MSYDGLLAKTSSIIFRPGGVAGGLVVTTWAEVQVFVALRLGTCIVYVDDSLGAAHVPATSGITDFFGKGEIRAFRNDRNYNALTVDDGATLKNLFRIAGTVFVLGATVGAVPALDWDFTGGQPNFFIEETAFVGNSPAATQPIISVPAAKQIWIYCRSSGGVLMEANHTLITIGAGGVCGLWSEGGALEASFGTFGLPATWAGGVGTSSLLYDSITLSVSGIIPLAGSAGTNLIRQMDSNLVEMSFNASANNVLANLIALAALPTAGTLPISVDGFGGTGGGGGGASGAIGNGGGGSGGCVWQSGWVDHNLAHPLNVVIGIAGGAGAAGVAPGGNGGDGTDGGPSSVLDATTGFTLASLQGSSGGKGGLAAGGGGNGGGTYAGASISSTIAAGFSAASFGGPGGANGGAHPGLPGQKGLVSLPNAATVAFAGGTAGASAGGQGGGGGGGGMGPFANGGAGGNATANVGGAGGASTANLGNGAGGGAGGTGAADNGGAGGPGALGFVRLRFIAP